ncbi:hypothetical protein FOA52_000164 [Chlamydomonas sp. UWO 241]|nr:hypothetical protein FOA52_000164 [Chlamydomonas sp. UWO 241]
MRAKGQAWEGDVKAHEYSGTYRWSQKTDFPPLPPSATPPSLGGGWQDYLATRLPPGDGEGSSGSSGSGSSGSGGASGGGRLVLDVAMLDSLSFPLSFLSAMRHVLTTDAGIKDWLYGGMRKLTIAALGTAERAEEHVLRHTNYFLEISHMMPSFEIELWLVGPEMTAAGHLSTNAVGPKLRARCFRGTLADWAAEQGLLEGVPGTSQDARKLVVIAFNSGMASGDAALQQSWKADVRRLLRHRVLSVFTCANDHSDLKCESKLMASLGARYVMPPRKNDFAAVTTLHPPGKKETSWYCANAYVYAVQGCTKDKESASTEQDGKEGTVPSGRGAAAKGPKGRTAAPAAGTAAASMSPPSVATAAATKGRTGVTPCTAPETPEAGGPAAAGRDARAASPATTLAAMPPPAVPPAPAASASPSAASAVAVPPHAAPEPPPAAATPAATSQPSPAATLPEPPPGSDGDDGCDLFLPD